MRIKYNGAINASSDKDYASLKGTDFDKAKAVLTKDGYKEHGYGDKDDNNGYAIYRKGDKEVELTYEWIKGKRNGEAHAGKVLDVYVDDNINGACGGKKSVKAATDGKIPYDLVSMLVALRDYADVSDAYVSDEHGKLVDIADSLYNVGEEVVETMKPEFKKVYEKYGKEYFDEVLDDISALDSQLTRNNVNDLIADYEDRADNFSGVESACGGKKSVKAAEQDGNCDKSFKMQGTTYCIEMINDGGSYVAKWWDSSDNGLGYNNKGWVALNNDFGRNTGKFNSENIESLLSVISEYDRKPGKPVQDRIKREVAKLINLDSINSSTNYNSIADIKAATDITNLKIIVNDLGHVEVYEDGYETGEGDYATEWDFDISGTYNNMQEVVDAIANEVGTTNDINDYVYIDGRIDTDMEQNNVGLRPTDAEYEAWKLGRETLYVAYISVHLEVGAEVHEMTEDEAAAFGLPL